MQPYFFPYIGYFSLINSVDKFILLDTVQFIRHGWIERNRICKDKGDWLYIQVPLIKPNSRDTLIYDCKINNNLPWQQKILSQLQYYKKRAPYYNKVIDIVKQLFDLEYDSITDLNRASLQMVCKYLDISCEIEIFSEMRMQLQKIDAPDDWALNICKEIARDQSSIEYVNPSGGAHLFDEKKYTQNNIALTFLEQEIVPYNQRNSQFIGGLSIIDVMMFNSVEEIKGMLQNYRLA